MIAAVSSDPVRRVRERLAGLFRFHGCGTISVCPVGSGARLERNRFATLSKAFTVDDFINGSFELAGALMLLFNIRQLMRDKCVRGCDWKPVVFFTLWGIWNLYYYPSLGQWCSFAGGCAIATVNAIWLWLVAYYSLRSSVAAEPSKC